MQQIDNADDKKVRWIFSLNDGLKENITTQATNK